MQEPCAWLRCRWRVWRSAGLGTCATSRAGSSFTWPPVGRRSIRLLEDFVEQAKADVHSGAVHEQIAKQPELSELLREYGY